MVSHARPKGSACALPRAALTCAARGGMRSYSAPSVKTCEHVHDVMHNTHPSRASASLTGDEHLNGLLHMRQLLAV